MKIYIVSLIYFIFGGASFLCGQNKGFIMPYAGYAANITLIETTTFPSTSETYSYANIHGGAYFRLLQKGESFSLGFDPSLSFGVTIPESSFYNDDLVLDYNLHVPVFLLARLGRGSTPYNRKILGFGFGLGAIANSYKLTTSSALNQRASFIHPAVMIEGNFSTGRGHISVKFRAPITRVINAIKYSNNFQNRDFYFNSWGLTVAYGFEKKRKKGA